MGASSPSPSHHKATAPDTGREGRQLGQLALCPPLPVRTPPAAGTGPDSVVPRGQNGAGPWRGSSTAPTLQVRKEA